MPVSWSENLFSFVTQVLVRSWVGFTQDGVFFNKLLKVFSTILNVYKKIILLREKRNKLLNVFGCLSNLFSMRISKFLWMDCLFEEICFDYLWDLSGSGQKAVWNLGKTLRIKNDQKFLIFKNFHELKIIFFRFGKLHFHPTL